MEINDSKALTMALASQEIYKDFEVISNGFFTNWSSPPYLINIDTTDTQLAILNDTHETTIVFRGSESRLDWKTNLNFRKQRKEFFQQVIEKEIIAEDEQIYPYSTGKKSGALIHRGFANAYLSVRYQIHDYIQTNQVSRLTVTGHSLGGALATLCALDLQYNFNSTLSDIEVYTFGAPKVGNKNFYQSYNKRVPQTHHFIYGLDIVPSLPRWWQGYFYAPQRIRLSSRWKLNFLSAQIKDHCIASYIRWLEKLL
ncbi:lipase family protein [Anabaenopsis elenkinii]|jgi:triacylglycerol lipase|uniref:Lipase family protein n=1 Tax=Anabaenopsis elenkinii CCIBt3563 TaxID=2779889 RepID=A0A7S6RI86_9CYAN|nr:lipase family protein [Anabaenopsis elenkinii]QOV23637.1 lipase family protein [Anabaenopsis elenkinii CCIBt3563]